MNVRNTLLIFGTILFVLSGCSDDAPTSQNSVKLNGQSFKITAATIAGVAIDGDGHAAISFVNATSTTSKTLSIDVEYSGDSNVAGSYSYPQQAGDRLLIDALTYYSEMSQSTMYSTTLASGSVTITKNGGNTYTVEMDLIMDDGKVFSGTYKGPFIAQFSNQNI
ncbi:MAG TPA: hypothetical protein VFU05_19740 [Cyclobacteriaceae bacterium]|nr:hypothetical protein [Cyclobacteriaceae bacterium]